MWISNFWVLFVSLCGSSSAGAEESPGYWKHGKHQESTLSIHQGAEISLGDECWIQYWASPSWAHPILEFWGSSWFPSGNWRPPPTPFALCSWNEWSWFHPAEFQNISTSNFFLHSRSMENLQSEQPKKCNLFCFTPVFSTENPESFCFLVNFPVLWQFQQKNEVNISPFLTQLGLNKTRTSVFLCVLCRPERPCGRWKSDYCYFLAAKLRSFHWERKQNLFCCLCWKWDFTEKQIWNGEVSLGLEFGFWHIFGAGNEDSL